MTIETEQFKKCRNEFKCFYNAGYPAHSWSALSAAAKKGFTWIMEDNNKKYDLHLLACLPFACRFSYNAGGCARDADIKDCVSGYCELKDNPGCVVILAGNTNLDNAAIYESIYIDIKNHDDVNAEKDADRFITMFVPPVGSVGGKHFNKKGLIEKSIHVKSQAVYLKGKSRPRTLNIGIHTLRDQKFSQNTVNTVDRPEIMLHLSDQKDPRYSYFEVSC